MIISYYIVCYGLFLQIGCLVSSLLMLVFRASESALWMGTSTFGLFMSNVFPTSVALAEQYFNVTGLSNGFRVNPFTTPKSAKFKTEEQILNLILQNCQKQIVPLERTAQ